MVLSLGVMARMLSPVRHGGDGGDLFGENVSFEYEIGQDTHW